MAPEYQFEKLYNEYYSTILRYVARIVGQNDARDITQDVFSKIKSGLAGFQGKSKLSTWIYRIATNTAIDRPGLQHTNLQRNTLILREMLFD